VWRVAFADVRKVVYWPFALPGRKPRPLPRLQVPWREPDDDDAAAARYQQAAPLSLSQRLSYLDAARQAGQITPEEYDKQRAAIIQST